MNQKSKHLFSKAFALLLISLFLLLVGQQIREGSPPKVSGEVELLFPATSSTLATLTTEQHRFERSFTDVITLQKPPSFSQTDFDFVLEDFEDDLLGIPGVLSLISPQTAASDDPFNLREEGVVRVIVKISSTLSQEERQNTHEALEGLINAYSAYSPRRGGSFLVSQEVSKVVATETVRVIPWVAIVLLVSLWVLFQSLKVAVFLLAITGISLGITILAYSQLGYALGPISQLAPPFLLAISSSFVVLVASRLRVAKEDEFDEVLSELRRGIALAALTTSSSLLSLLFIDVQDVANFSILGACGVILSALAATALPQLCLPWLLSPERRSSPSLLSSFFQNASRARYAIPIILLCLGLSAGIPRLEVHTDPLRFLPAGHHTLKDIAAIRQAFPGGHFLSLIIEDSAPTENGKIPGELLNSIGRRVRAVEGVTNVITPYDFLERNRSRKSAGFTEEMRIRDSIVPLDFMTPDRNFFRVIIETAAEGKKLLALKEALESTLQQERALVEDYTYGLTSLELIMAEQTDLIVFGLMESLLTTLVIIFLLLLFLFRNVQVALIGLIPNVLPLIAVFGILGFMVGELDFGSTLVATSALGIAVDNTFHFLLCWREQSRRLGQTLEGVAVALQKVHQPFLTASLSLVAAFATMLLAHSAPVENFGFLLAVTLCIGLLADLIVLPAILKTFCKSQSI